MLNKIYITYCFIGIGIVSCEGKGEAKSIPFQSSTTKVEMLKDEAEVIDVKKDDFGLEVIFSPEFGWGYQIFNNGNLFINQPHIPSIQGNNGFKDKGKAIKTAEYIIFKLEHNLFPPTISPEELDSLGVL